MAAAAAEASAEQANHLLSDQLVLRGIAPIKHEYLLPVQLVERQEVAAVGSSVAPAGESAGPAAPVAPKSRNQQKKVCVGQV
jgi:hypothetical protein